MKQDIPSHIAKFICSQQTETSEIQARIFSLGKALVEELALEPGVDTLARWMAHYVAEQMTLAENTHGDEKTHAEQQCFDAILKLWQHRSRLPNGQRPFENFEAIFRTLEKLDPERPNAYFYSTPHDESGENTDEVQQWLDMALRIDKAVRVLLESVLHQAALNATDEKALAWLERSKGLPKSHDMSVITHLLDFDEDDNHQDAAQRAKQAQREQIESRINTLDAFIELSQILRAGFLDELNAIS